MKKKIGIAFLCLFILSGCGSVKLANGENVLVSFGDKEGISSQEYYNLLKDKYGVSDLVDLIDTYLLEKEYDTDDDEKKYIEDYINSIKSYSGEENYLSILQSYYNIDNEKDFKEYIRLNYRRTLWAKEYAKSQVNDKQIKEYYDEVAVGDITASHILISSEATDGMTDEERKAAEEKALKTAKELIERLNKGEDFATLAKEYSDDSSNASDGGVLPAFNTFSNYDENFLDAAIKLKVGEYTKSPVKSQYGYHIIYKTKQDEKKSLDDLKENIINAIADETMNNDTNIYAKAISNLREKYNMKIEDSKLNVKYNTYMGNIE